MFSKQTSRNTGLFCFVNHKYSMFPLLITPPEGLPITTEFVNKFAQHNTDDDADLVELFLNEAWQHFEEMTQVVLLTSTWRTYVECFKTNQVYLMKYPVTEVTGVFYGDYTSEAEPTEFTDYTTDLRQSLTTVTFNSWPTLQESEKLWIDFVAGYGTEDNVPPRIRRALAMYVRHCLRNRNESVDSRLQNSPLGYMAAVRSYSYFQGNDWND